MFSRYQRGHSIISRTRLLKLRLLSNVTRNRVRYPNIIKIVGVDAYSTQGQKKTFLAPF